ncbi:MAG: SPOR domain-containing protein [Acidobacteria bacterium]|nr:SPOR domain-containing protein [Acidobacteriota bacterium]
MPRNEEGEFELVLGNKQLLSVFFIVIILMGVCFAMGYIIGRNSTPAGTETIARNKKEAPAIVVDSSPSTAPSTGSSSSGMAPGQVSFGGEAAPAVEPAPAPSKPAPMAEESPKPVPAGTKAARKPEPAPAPAAAAPLAPAAVSNRVVEPTAGQIFLQVLAVARPDAELTVETLGKKGFHALIAPGPSDKLFRVLVGPLKDQADVAKTRSGLEGVGFRAPIVRKY